MKRRSILCAVYGILCIISWFEAFFLAQGGILWAFYVMMLVFVVSWFGFLFNADPS